MQNGKVILAERYKYKLVVTAADDLKILYEAKKMHYYLRNIKVKRFTNTSIVHIIFSYFIIYIL